VPLPHRLREVEEEGLARKCASLWGPCRGRGRIVDRRCGAVGLEHGRVLVGAAADLDEVDAGGDDEAHLLEAGLEAAGALLTDIDAVHLDADAELRAGGGADALDDAQDHLGALGRAAAELVRAQIRLGRQELRDQVAVRAVQLDALEAREVGLLGALDELLDGLVDLGARHFAGGAEHGTRGDAGDGAGSQVEGDGRGGEVLGEERALSGAWGRLAARVAELHESGCSVLLRCRGPVAPRRLEGRRVCGGDRDGNVSRGTKVGLGDLDIACNRGRCENGGQKVE
jgi:hypothetical protein